MREREWAGRVATIFPTILKKIVFFFGHFSVPSQKEGGNDGERKKIGAAMGAVLPLRFLFVVVFVPVLTGFHGVGSSSHAPLTPIPFDLYHSRCGKLFRCFSRSKFFKGLKIFILCLCFILTLRTDGFDARATEKFPDFVCMLLNLNKICGFLRIRCFCWLVQGFASSVEACSSFSILRRHLIPFVCVCVLY